MKKHVLFIALIMLATTLLFGCKSETNSELNITGEPETYFAYGLNEECSNGAKNIKVESFEISTEYKTDGDTSNGSGYYAVFDVATNLTAEDFLNQDNTLELWLSSSQAVRLDFALWDSDNGKLVFEIAKSENIDYLQLNGLKASESDAEYPFVSLLFKAFDEYCTVNGEQYCGKIIVLKLAK